MKTELNLLQGRVHLSSINFTSFGPIYLFYLTEAELTKPTMSIKFGINISIWETAHLPLP